MFLKFNHAWGKNGVGDIAEIELTLSRRLVGMGIAEYITDLKPRTTPDFNVVEEPVVEEASSSGPAPEEEVEEPVKEEAPVKKPVKRKYTRPEKAVKIEK